MTRITGGSIIAVVLLACAGTIPVWSAPDQSGLLVRQLMSMWESGDTAALGAIATVSPDPLATVRRYQDLMQRHDIDGLLALYAADAGFVFSDQQVISGTDGLRRLHEWDQAHSTQLELEDLRVIGNEVVVGSLIERNDWFRALGLAEVRYQPGTRFLVRGGRIAGIWPTAFSAATQQLFVPRFTALLNWLEANHPGVRDRLLPGGHFEYSAASARLWLELMAEWNGAGAPAGSARGQDERRAPREYGDAERRADAQPESAAADREREP